MPEKKIYILTGPVGSGKTTYLQKFCRKKQNIYGVLSPVINAKRFFVDVANKEVFPMEVEDGELNTLTVGRYTFSSKAFEKACSIIKRALQYPAGVLVIDEIGPLELNCQGLYSIVRETIEENHSHAIISVVRETLIDDVVNFFGIKDYEVVRTNAEIAI
ncbi:MAG TPA: nucleoside-triphosphatase [Flavisolibacter sp.]|nr:nucleoside-triphosphatase [Flavisolibacter sp.]